MMKQGVMKRCEPLAWLLHPHTTAQSPGNFFYLLAEYLPSHPGTHWSRHGSETQPETGLHSLNKTRQGLNCMLHLAPGLPKGFGHPVCTAPSEFLSLQAMVGCLVVHPVFLQ